MTRDEIRAALVEQGEAVKEIRTNDGRVFLVQGIERWALGADRLVVLEGPGQHTLAIRNIASIGTPSPRGRRRRRRGAS